MSDVPFNEERPYDPASNILAYQVYEHGRSLREIFSWRRDIDKTVTQHEGDVENLERAVASLKLGLESVQRTMIALLVTIAASAVTVALSVLIATGKL